MIKVLIADNQILTREGIISILSGFTDMQIIGQVTNRAEIEQMIVAYKPHVIIIDPLNSSEIKKISRHLNPANVVVLSNRKQKNEILEVINLGIKNYV
ncbi:MAG: hypothetical protein ABI308_13100, partial [Mucilaginibacter sp.]